MKILILANNDVGLYRFRNELIDELSHSAEVVLSLPYGPMVENFTEKGYRFVDTPIDRRGINPVKDIFLLAKYIKLIKKERPDLVITYTIKPNIYGGIACRLCGVRYCENITGLGTAFQKKGALLSVVTFLYKAALKKATTVFFENSDNLNTLVTSGIISNDKTVLLNGAGVNLDYFDFKPYPDVGKRTEFLFIGRVMKEKGIYELIEAMRRLTNDGEDCILHILGGCEEDCEPILRKNESDGILKYHGHVDDVKPYIEACHCFVLPSYHEGMANTNLECSSMGRPIITSNIPGCKEAMPEEYSDFLVTPANSESLYNAMKAFIALTPEQKSDMALKARRHAENNFDKRSVIEQTVCGLKFSR